MIALILFLVLYVVPAIGAWQSFRRKYSPGGDWDLSSPNMIDVCIVFVPLGNIVICLIAGVDYLQETNARSFFRIDEDRPWLIDEEEELRKETEAYNKWKSAHDSRRKKLQKD